MADEIIATFEYAVNVGFCISRRLKTEQVQKKWELCGKYVDFVHERIKISLQFDEISRMP